MEKYVEIRIAAHKLCDSSHNFMDRGIKGEKLYIRIQSFWYQRTQVMERENVALQSFLLL